MYKWKDSMDPLWHEFINSIETVEKLTEQLGK